MNIEGISYTKSIDCGKKPDVVVQKKKANSERFVKKFIQTESNYQANSSKSGEYIKRQPQMNKATQMYQHVQNEDGLNKGSSNLFLSIYA